MNTPLQLASFSESTDTVRHYLPESSDLERTPFALSDLTSASQLLIWSIRKWLQIRRFPGKFDNQIMDAHRTVRLPEAAESLEDCMAILASSALRPVIIECPCQPYLSCDELTLLKTFRALSSKTLGPAEQHLARLVKGRIANVFCRSAKDYVLSLSAAGFDLNRITKLKLVEEKCHVSN